MMCFLLAPAVVQAQPSNDEQLAVQYFQKGEFELAVMYYEKLYNKSRSAVYYEYYYKCLVELERYKEAEKLVKRQMKRFPNDLTYYVDLGTLYDTMEEENRSKQQYEKAIKALSADYKQIRDLANAFIQKNELDMAISCYEKGSKLLKNNTFDVEIASVMGLKGDYEGMINVYLDLLGENDNYIQQVQSNLNRTLNFMEDEERSDMLKGQLLRRVQRNPQKTIYSDMLIWLFEQRKEFNAAYVQSKALDKREKGWGERLLDLGRLCRSNYEYDIAIKCFHYIVELGPNGYYYTKGKVEWLETMNLKITQSNYTQEDLMLLEENYISTLQELGRSVSTSSMMRDQAHLQAFYLNKRVDAVELLEETLKLPGMSRKDIAETKLELADILVLDGSIWDASLYYSQVDHDFKHDILGHEAKFRNAKISFYTGDFEWAQAQLDVLKTSTSKLIANDAMDLSLLITDNLNMDTTPFAMMLYAEAELLLFQNQFDESNRLMDKILEDYPGHSLTDEVEFQKYRIERKRQNYEKAIEHLQRILNNHGDDILADDAAFNIGEIYQFTIKDTEKAIEFYEKLLMDYEGSLFTVEARKRYRALKGDTFESPEIKKIE